jgi:excisionase family DNA binding protein
MSNEFSAPAGRLSFRPKEAAKALGVSERVLWQWTRDGVIPHLRQGRVVLYPVEALRAWLRCGTRPQEGGQP